MIKAKAIELLGGSIASAAEAIGVTYQAVDKWPDPLPARIEDRVIAFLARRHLSPEQLGAEPDEAEAKVAWIVPPDSTGTGLPGGAPQAPESFARPASAGRAILFEVEWWPATPS